MAKTSYYSIHSGSRVLLNDLGLRLADILRRAGLSEDLFEQEKVNLSTSEYFRLWRSIEEESGDPTLSIRLGEALTTEAFDPLLFAALCSSNLNIALVRIAHYKRLVCPMKLHVDVGTKTTTLSLEWPHAVGEIPVSMVAVELVFFVQLARMATRTRVTPLRVSAPEPPEPKADYAEYFGVAIRRGPSVAITFTSEDATRPFLTANERMWEFFEPDLRKRLSELDETATTSDRVHAALLELLPSGEASIATVSKKLGTGARTLKPLHAGLNIELPVVVQIAHTNVARTGVSLGWEVDADELRRANWSPVGRSVEASVGQRRSWGYASS